MNRLIACPGGGKSVPSCVVAPGLFAQEAGGGFWNLTHQSSGYAVVYYLPTLKAAVLTAEFLARNVDWTRSVEELVQDQRVASAIHDARELFPSGPTWWAP